MRWLTTVFGGGLGLLGAACASSGDDNSSASGAGATGGSSAASGAGASGGTSAAGGLAGTSVGGAGGGGAGAGMSNAGRGGQEPSGAGKGAGGVGGTQGGAGSGGTDATGLDAPCAFTDLSSSYSATADDTCTTGYCLWDGRSLGETYCTIACDGLGATCPNEFLCLEDLEAAGKFWCGRPERVVPPDVGNVSCTSSFSSGCFDTAHKTDAFCIGGPVDECTDGYCLGDPIAKANYCTTTCRDPKAPCPQGFDCIHDPSTTFEEYRFCAKHHEPIEFTGLFCNEGSVECVAPCPTYSEGPDCAADGSGICLHDVTTTYCSARCEDATCPDGFACEDIVVDAVGAPPSGKYCVKM